MANIIKLTGIGYWHSFLEPGFPDPGSFVDDLWNIDEKEKIAAYLRSAQEMPYAYGGLSWCRFRCGISNLGSLEFTDGKYLWPEGLPHYIEAHNIKLPREVIDHMLANRKTEPVTDNFTVDWEWWKKQKGGNTENKTFNDRLDIGVLTIIQVNDKMKHKQEHVLRNYLIDAYGVKGRLSAIDKVLTGQETRIKGRFQNINDFLLKLTAIGLRGEFHYMTKEEYGID